MGLPAESNSAEHSGGRLMGKHKRTRDAIIDEETWRMT